MDKMDVARKAAYLQGLAKGLGIDDSTKEGKLLLALVDAFGDLAEEVSDMEDAWSELDEAIDVLDDDLQTLEEDFYSFDEAEDDDDCDCGCCDEEEELYEVTCPQCGETVYLDPEMLEEGEMNCPNCNELLEFIKPEELDEILAEEEDQKD
ncbi:Uncharacterised protein [uncultured Ruminococcus sp.]|nr:CD1247 N-terminal domain-containing protein [Massiliimalia timonensis]SCH08963.1 Uncharacterised protein [uncultured Ruminococcus sp.]SCH77630.1 Uncharacterised protein [uncultured Clostridium sp.]